jgi:ketosteroid isomerase-like protein
VVAHEDGIVFCGSQAGDKQVGWEAVRRSFEEQFAEVSDIKSEVLDSTISVVGDAAWAAYDLRYAEAGGAAAGLFESRWTCVLRRHSDGWKFVHMHHSRGR